MAFTESGVTLTSYFALKSDWSPYLQAGGAVAVGNNSYGQLGQYNATNISSPIAIVGGAGWLDAAVLRNGQGTTFVSDEGSVYFSGIFSTNLQVSPIQIGLIKKDSTYLNPYAYSWNSVQIGSSSSAIAQDGTLWAWGSNAQGALGLSDTTNRSTPTQVGTNSDWLIKHGSLAIKTDGTMWSWGFNSSGQLGLSNTTNRSSPVQIGLLSNWSKITQAGTTLGSSLALKSDGTLWSWGINSWGVLGNNTTVQSNVLSPIQIGTLSNWAQISIGYSQNHFLAIDSLGQLWSWGNNSSGQLGQSNTTHRSSPVQVGLLSDWYKVSAGFFHTLAIKTDGTLWAWGNNASGQLGTSNLTNRFSPVQIGLDNNWSEIFASWSSSSAIKTDGTLWTWGDNANGQMGLSDRINRSGPTQVSTESGWSKIQFDNSNFIGIKNGAIWGSGSALGLGIGYFSSQNYPLIQTKGSFKKVTTSNTHSYFQDFDNQITQYSIEDIPLIDPTVSWSTYDTGLNHFVGIKPDGTAWSIGSNSYGQLGFDTTIPILSVFGGARGSNGLNAALFFINTNRGLFSCGYNSGGKLGLGNLTSRSSPAQVGTSSNWSQVNNYDNNTLAIKTDGTLWAWGTNDNGQLGTSNTTAFSDPVQVGTESYWSQVGVGYWNTSAVKTDGTLWAWGNNLLGSLGNGTQGAGQSRSSPIQLGTDSNWVQTACGYRTGFALKTDGTIWSWGSSALKNGNYLQQVSGSNFSKFSFSSFGNSTDTVILIKTNGTLWACGYNDFGQLGTNTTTRLTDPVQVGALSNWSQISIGQRHCLAIKTDGTLWAWGRNNLGQLGLSDLTNRSSPVQVGTLSNWTNIAAGALSSYAVNSEANNLNLYVWGNNAAGELGTNNLTNRSTPTQIVTNSLISSISSLTQIGSNTNWTKAIAADYGSMLIDNSYNAFVFGENDTYQLGLSDTTNRSSPVQITYTPVITASMDERNVWLIDANNNIWQSGVDNNNYFGIGQTQRVTPVQVGSLSNWSQASGFSHNTAVVKTDNTLWVWGRNSPFFQLAQGDTTDRSSPVQMGTLSNWTQVVVATFHTAAINTIGQLWSWGSNSYGQLGVWDLTNRSSPIQVIGGSSDASVWKQISGSVSNLMVTTQGTMWSCGQNSFGQLGTSDQVNKSTPVQIGSLSNWNQVSINALSAAAVKTDGTLWAWGSNASGQLGQSNTTNRSSPVQIGTLSNWSQVVIGGITATFALQSDGTLWGWGSNSFGQLGTNTSTQSNVLSPVQIGTLSNWSQVSVGGIHTVATKTDGTLWVWGGNSFGQLGLSDVTHRSSPVQVGALNNWTSISAGITQSVAVNSNNLYSWGNNSWGQLGLGDVTHRYTPVQVGALSNWNKVSCGFLFTTSLKTDGTLWAWGINSYGELSQSNQTHRSSPVQIGALSNWTAINSQGYVAYNSLAINTNGFLWGSGLNTFGSLGQNDVISRFSPVQIIGRNYSLWNKLANHISFYSTFAINTNGTLWSWGNNSNGQLGLNDQTDRRFPVQIGTASNWSQASSGQSTVAVNSIGEIWSWGNNSFGQLGNFQQSQQNFPAKIEAVNKWKLAACGYYHVNAIDTYGTLWGWGGLRSGGGANLGSPFVINGTQFPTQISADTDWAYVHTGYITHGVKTNGTMWSWGGDSNGSSGLNTTTAFSSPAQVGNLSNWSTLDGTLGHGRYLTAAVKADGTLWTTGNNFYGQLGLSDLTNRSSFTQVGSLSNWAQVVCGYYHGVAVKTDGTLWSWGYNQVGQLGLGDLTDRSSPVQIGTLSNWSKLSTADYGVISLKTDGTLWAWGSNGAGTLGLNTNSNLNFSSPVQIGTDSNWIQFNFSSTVSAMAIKSDRTLWGWGAPANFVLGNNSNSGNRSSPVQIGTLSNWSFIAPGRMSASPYFSVMINSEGDLYMAGGNSYGALGLEDRTAFDRVPTLTATATTQRVWSQLSAGYQHTAALTSNGKLWSWGRNDVNQTGFGTFVNNASPTSLFSPVQLLPYDNWTQISNSAWGIVALNSNGTLWGSGSAANGALANTIRNAAYTYSMVQIGTTSDWYQVSTGSAGSLNTSFGLAIKTDGTLWAWGSGSLGPLGLGDSTDRWSVVQVGALSNWAQINCGYYEALAIKTDNTLWAWGYNITGQLGLGDLVTRSSPVQVGALSNWSQAKIGYYHSLAIKTDGTLWAWGRGNEGQLGNNSAAASASRSSPIQIGPDTNWSQIAVAFQSSMAIKTDGTLWAWGVNSFGILGLSNLTSRSSPVQVGTLSDWSKINISSHAIALKTDNTLWSWGANSVGQLGNNSTALFLSPIQVGTLSNWSIISNNYSVGDTSGAISSDGLLWLWGQNNLGQLGQFSTINRSTPTVFGTAQNYFWKQVSCGYTHTIALNSNGTLWSWGLNTYGQLGLSDLTNRISPVQIGTLSNWAQIEAGNYHTVAVNSLGQLYTWGRNEFGQQGDFSSFTYPVQKSTTDRNYTGVVTHKDNTLFTKNDSTIWSVGNNFFGALGLNNTTAQILPIQIGTINNVGKIDTKNYSSIIFTK